MSLIPLAAIFHEACKAHSQDIKTSMTLSLPGGWGGEAECPGDQQPPVVSCLGRSDGVIYALNDNGGIGNARTIVDVWDGALDSPVDLVGHTYTHTTQRMRGEKILKYNK